MKFTTVNGLDTIGLKDMKIEQAALSGDTLSFLFSGGIIKANNENNTRYQDVYCMQMSMELCGIDIKRFVLQGFKYYDPDGKLIREIPDEELTPQGQAPALKKAVGAEVFEFTAENGGYVLVYDVLDDDQDIVETYQIDFTVQKSIVSWDRFAGPVEG